MNPSIFKALLLGVAMSAFNGDSDAAASGATQENRDEALIAAACAAKGSILVIDLFQNTNPDYGYLATSTTYSEIDIDGDNVPDMLHGDLTAKIVALSGREPVTYGLRAHEGSEILGALANISWYIRSGMIETPAAVIVPLTYSLSFERINNEIMAAAGMNGREITQDNVNGRREELITAYNVIAGTGNPLVRIQSLIEELEEMGVPVIVPAGNDYGRSINMAVILGAVSIGASANNEKIAAPYSDHSSLTSVYRSGDVIGRLVDGGIDINNNGQADFSSDVLSGGQSISARYDGAAAEITTLEDLRRERPSEAFLMARDWYPLIGVTSLETIQAIETLYGAVIHYPSGTPFQIDENGRLHYDPSGDGHTGQVSYNFGSSFAVPKICEPQS